MMKKIAVALIAVGLAVASQAAFVIDDFEEYNVGTLNDYNSSTVNTGTGWIGTSENSGTSNVQVELDPINGAPNQVAAVHPANGSIRGVSKQVGLYTLTEGDTATLSFDMATGSTNDSVVCFGMGSVENDLPKKYNNKSEAFVYFQGGNIYACNGGGEIHYTNINVNATNLGTYVESTWYSFDLVINNVTDTFDVLIDGVPAASGLSFLNGVRTMDLTQVTFWSGGSASDYGYLDNITIDGLAIPFAILEPSPEGEGIAAQPTLEVAIVDGTDTVDAGSISLIFNGVDVTASSTISYISPTTLVSYVVSTPLAPESINSASISAAGTVNTTPIIIPWTFEVRNGLSFGAVSPEDGAVIFSPSTISAEVIDDISTLDPSTITFAVDGINVPSFTVSTNGTGTTTLSYDVATPFDPLTTHDALVSVEGANPFSGPYTNTWEFSIRPGMAVDLFDDFQTYVAGPGTISNDTSEVWLGIGVNGRTANPQIQTDGANNWLSCYGTRRGAYRSLGTQTNGVVTLEFDAWTDSATNNMSIGLASGVDGSETWNDFAAYVVISGNNLQARNGGQNTNLVINAFTNTTPADVHSVKIVADIDAGTYDVYFDDVLEGSSLAFRNGPVYIDYFKIYGNTGTPTDLVNIDNINYSIKVDPFSITSISIAGGNATIVWESQVGATYNILSKSTILQPTWTTNQSGIASQGDDTTSAVVTPDKNAEFFTVEGRY